MPTIDSRLFSNLYACVAWFLEMRTFFFRWNDGAILHFILRTFSLVGCLRTTNHIQTLHVFGAVDGKKITVASMPPQAKRTHV